MIEKNNLCNNVIDLIELMGQSISFVPEYFYKMKKGTYIYALLAFFISVTLGFISDFPLDYYLASSGMNGYLYFILVNIISFSYMSLTFYLLFKILKGIFNLSLDKKSIWLLVWSMCIFDAIFSLAFMNVGLFSLVFSSILMTGLFLAFNSSWIKRSNYISLATSFVTGYLLIELVCIFIFVLLIN